jgi:hypothetical protein
MTNLNLQQEIIRALINIIIVIITLGISWLIGHRLTVYWAIRQKRRELELTVENEFYKLYGEFFSVWKLWAYCVSPRKGLKVSEMTRWSLLERACAAEGALEAIFVKLSSERTLSEFDIEILGRFRQAYQQLRESIRDNKDIGWWSHDQIEYSSFKRLAYLTACVITSRRLRKHKGDVLIKITNNTWEENWVLSDDSWDRLKNVHDRATHRTR